MAIVTGRELRPKTPKNNETATNGVVGATSRTSFTAFILNAVAGAAVANARVRVASTRRQHAAARFLGSEDAHDLAERAILDLVTHGDPLARFAADVVSFESDRR